MRKSENQFFLTLTIRYIVKGISAYSFISEYIKRKRKREKERKKKDRREGEKELRVEKAWRIKLKAERVCACVEYRINIPPL